MKSEVCTLASSSVDVVILNYRVGLMAARAAQSAHQEGAGSIIVLDNYSNDDSLPILQREVSDFAKIIPLASNLGFSSANNIGASHGKNPLILFMNPDVILKPGALTEMIRILNENPSAGAVGPSLYYIDGRPQASAYFFLTPGKILNLLLGIEKLTRKFKMKPLAGNADHRRNGNYTGVVESLYGACILMRRNAFEAVGGFDEDFFLYCEETDLCLRLARNGWKIYRAGNAQVIHCHGQSASQISRTALVLMSESHKLYSRKHFSRFGRMITAFAFVVGMCLRFLLAPSHKIRVNYFAALGVWLGWTPSADARKNLSQSSDHRVLFPGDRNAKALSNQNSIRLTVIFHRIGPYHFARLRAAGLVAKTFSIEIFKTDEVYAWNLVPNADGFQRTTLFEKKPTNYELKKSLKIALNNAHPEIVVIPGWSDAVSFNAMQWSMAHNVPIIVMSESTEWDESRHWWKEWIKRRILRMCAVGFVGGKPHAEYLAQLGISRDRIFEGYDAVDNAYFTTEAHEARKLGPEERKKLALPEKYFLASARFVEKKNLLLLLRSYALYREMIQKSPIDDKRQTWKLILMGDGPLQQEIDNERSRLNVFSDVILPGFKQYNELPIYYGFAQAFIHASTTEQWGLVVNEAMASGLPVLVSNRCGCAQDLVKEGVNGFTFEPDNAEELAGLMLKISAPNFPLSDFGLESQRIISQWGPERFATGLKQAMQSALLAPPSKPTVVDHLLLKLLLLK